MWSLIRISGISGFLQARTTALGCREPRQLTKKSVTSSKAFASSSRLTICMWHDESED